MKYFLFSFFGKSLKIDANSSVDMWKNPTERPSSLGLFFVAIFWLQTLSLYFLQVYSGFLFLPESVLVARNLSISSSCLICWHAYSIPLYPLYFCKVCSNAFFFVLTSVICLVFLDLSGVLSILLVSFKDTTFSYADFTYCISIIYFINSPSISIISSVCLLWVFFF